MSERKFAKARFTPESNEHEELTAVATLARLAWWDAKRRAHIAREAGLSLFSACESMRDALLAKQHASRLMRQRWERMLGGVG